MNKQVALKDITEKVDRLVDGLGRPVDEGIKRLVVGLFVNGFVAGASCEGHLDHGLAYPWVDIEVTPGENWRNDKGLQIAWQRANLKQRKAFEKVLKVYQDEIPEKPVFWELKDYGIFGAFRLQPVDKNTLTTDQVNGYKSEVERLASYLIGTSDGKGK